MKWRWGEYKAGRMKITMKANYLRIKGSKEQTVTSIVHPEKRTFNISSGAKQPIKRDISSCDQIFKGR